MCSTACLLTDGAIAAGAALFFELAFFRCATRPCACQAPGDASGMHNVQQARSTALDMRSQPLIQAAGAPQGVACVLGAGVEVQQGDHRLPLWSPAAGLHRGSLRSPCCTSTPAPSTQATPWGAPAAWMSGWLRISRAVERACCTLCMPLASPGAWHAHGLVAQRKNASSKNNAAPAAIAPSVRRHAVLHITKYRNTRYWAVWEGHKLLCVTVYKK